MQVVLASSNKGKITELSFMLARLNFSVIPQTNFSFADAEETGLSFVENAIIKARNASKNTKLPSIADDSGIEVDYLQGEPGIYSARYSGAPNNSELNNQKLLQKLENIKNRKANFRCVLVYLRHHLDPAPIIAEGVWHGEILTSPQGKNGFGYDPVFGLPEYKISAAELDPNIKNKISHRAQALKILQKKLSLINLG